MRVRWLLGGLGVALLLLAGGAAGPTAATTGGLAPSRLTALFDGYGDTSGQWLGADRTASVPLPDGRVLWLFSDTFLGAPTPAGARPPDVGFVHNSAIVQEGDRLTTTVTGRGRTSLFGGDAEDAFSWIGDGLVSGNSVQVLTNLYRRTGPGPLDHRLAGTALGTLTLPGLAVAGPVRQLPVGDRVSWGSEVLGEGEHTYVYGTEAAGPMKFAHLARVRGADLGAAWEFWTGSGWSPDPAASARMLSGVGTSYGVRRQGEQFVLVTHENNLMFSADVVAYTADSPSGPWTGPDYLFRAPEIDAGHIVYDADLHQHLARTGTLLVSYNVNNLDETTAAADAGIYRPRFVEVDWPRPAGDGARPDAPSGLSAAPSGAGRADLSWRPPRGGGLTFRVQRRDVTAGQTHFVRLPGAGPGAARTYGSDFLINGHVYEFTVTAVNRHGESRPSAVATMTATVPPPPPPGGLQAVAGTAGEVALRWQPVPFVQLFKVFRRDVTAGEKAFAPAGSFPHEQATVGPLRHGHVYEFTVAAVGGGGDGKPGPAVRATAFVTPPPPPGGVRAEPRPDGSIRVSWAGGARGISYQVRRRDVTAGEGEFGQVALVARGSAYTTERLPHGHTFEFAVAAVNGGGPGRPSAPARAVASIPAPAGLHAEVEAGRVELRWQTAGPHWVFTRDLTLNQRDFVRDPVAADDRRATLVTLADGHRYEIKIATVAAGGGAGPAGQPVQVTLPSPAPTAVTATATGPGAVRVTWRATKPGLAYRIELRDATAGEPWRTDPYPVTGSAFETVLLTSGHRYEFRVIVDHGPGDQHASGIASVTAR